MDAITFAVEDALFDEVPYRPWISPLGTPRSGGDHGDRRVIGRLRGEPVAVTDLPPHIVHRSYPPEHAVTMQYFETARDVLEWVTHSAAGTRFLGPAATWPAELRHRVAARAVHSGLVWDAEGNISIPPDPRTTPQDPRRTLRLAPADDGSWSVLDADTEPPRPLGPGDVGTALDSPLYDLDGDDPFLLVVHLLGDGPIR
ncbi:hypothetical protein [Jatrophihabitans fulvus]